MKIAIGYRVFAALVLSMVCSTAAVAQDRGQPPQGSAQAGEPRTVRGEVLDLACYVAHKARGPEHRQNALHCFKEGAQAGLLTDGGELFLLVQDPSYPDSYKTVLESASEQVTVTGLAPAMGESVRPLIVRAVEKARR